jgi:hypothetical protein
MFQFPDLSFLIQMLPLAVTLLVALAIMFFCASLLVRFYELRRLLRRPCVFLEITPPVTVDKTPQATQQLFSVLHGVGMRRTFRERLTRQQVTFSLEVVSTRENGIRYIMRVGEQEADAIQRTIASYLPSVRVRRVEDYLTTSLDNQAAKVISFKQKGAYAFPLRQQLSFEEHDPIAYLAGSMAELSKDDQIILQLVLQPASIPDAAVVSKKILANEDLLNHLSHHRHAPIAQKGFSYFGDTLSFVMDLVTDIFHGSSHYGTSTTAKDSHDKRQVAMRLKPARSISLFEQELVESVHKKVSQPLYLAELRALVVADSQNHINQRTKALNATIASFDTGYQSLRVRANLPLGIKRRYRSFLFKNRLPSFFRKNSSVFAASEIADLYHFPSKQTSQAGTIAKSLSRTLPPSLILKSLADKAGFDVVLGRNEHQGISTDIGLTAAERERHVYIVGGTGNGKSTMLKYSIIQDIRSGKGVALVDPHGDLARDILRYIPQQRIKDVVYLNPVDIKYPVGFNLLELPKNLDADETLLEQQRVTEAVISVMRKVFDDDESTGAHRIEDMLRNTIHTAMTIEDATLFTILKLLRNETYRKRIVADLEDDFLKDFWREEIAKAGSMQRISMSKGVTSRIDRFRTSPSAKRILEQPKSTINFEDIINNGKILICNLAEGEIGEDTSALFGTSIMAELKMAAERRSQLPSSKRRPFYVYVDEFQNFATESFTKMLSGSRKYKLFLTIAQQSTAQQKTQRVTEALLSNLSTVICFRTGSPADEELLLSRFIPYLEPGDISNLPTYNFFARLSAINPQEPVSGTTLLLEDEGSEEVARQVVKASRSNYAKEYVTPDIKKTKTRESSTRKTSQEDNRMPVLDAPADI